jgi:hypothetical protein
VISRSRARCVVLLCSANPQSIYITQESPYHPLLTRHPLPQVSNLLSIEWSTLHRERVTVGDFTEILTLTATQPAKMVVRSPNGQITPAPPCIATDPDAQDGKRYALRILDAEEEEAEEEAEEEEEEELECDASYGRRCPAEETRRREILCLEYALRLCMVECTGKRPHHEMSDADLEQALQSTTSMSAAVGTGTGGRARGSRRSRGYATPAVARVGGARTASSRGSEGSDVVERQLEFNSPAVSAAGGPAVRV